MRYACRMNWSSGFAGGVGAVVGLWAGGALAKAYRQRRDVFAVGGALVGGLLGAGLITPVAAVAPAKTGTAGLPSGVPQAFAR